MLKRLRSRLLPVAAGLAVASLAAFAPAGARYTPAPPFPSHSSSTQQFYAFEKAVGGPGGDVTGFCVDDPLADATWGTKIQLWKCIPGEQQQSWSAVSVGGNYYQLQLPYGAGGPADCLDDTNGGGAGTHLQIWGCKGGDGNQSWTPSSYYAAGTWPVLWINATSGDAIDLPGNNNANGQFIQVWPVKFNPNQAWKGP